MEVLLSWTITLIVLQSRASRDSARERINKNSFLQSKSKTIAVVDHPRLQLRYQAHNKLKFKLVSNVFRHYTRVSSLLNPGVRA
jgi:hypothetical protein